jgi:hypothetical protein
MKKIISFIAISTFIVSCNNAGESTEEKKDSIDSVAYEQKKIIDFSAEEKKEHIDSVTRRTKDSLDRIDSINIKDTVKNK